MAKLNFKTPILTWLAAGGHHRWTLEKAMETFKAEHPELKSKKRVDKAFGDYYKRYQAGMRATERKADVEPEAKAKPAKKAKAKKEAPAKKLAGPRLFLQHGVIIPNYLN